MVEIRKPLRDLMRHSAFLVILGISGVIILTNGFNPPWNDLSIAIGTTFIISTGVGVYMMVMSHNVAKGLHGRFDKLGITLNDHHQEVTGILRENHVETTGILREIASSQKEIALSQKEIALSQKEMAASLKNIEHILDKKS